MSSNNFNEFVSAVNLLGDKYDVDTNNVVVIDTENNRIGIGTQNPSYDLDISKVETGNGKNKIKIKNLIIDGDNQKIDILNNNKYIDFSNSDKIVTDFSGLEYKLLSGARPTFTLYNDISINGDLSLINLYINDNCLIYGDISVNGDISCVDICCNDICANYLYIYNDISINGDISCLDICCNDICANNLYINNDISINGDICANNLYIKNDISINGDISCLDICSNDISCNILYVKNKIVYPNSEFETIGVPRTTSSLIMGGSIPSDDRLKHNEKKITNTLNTIKSLNPIIYDKTKTFKKIDYMGDINEEYIKEIGLIAQDVEKIDDLSFSVTKGSETEPYKLNYNNIFNYCIGGLKESIITNEISYNIMLSKLNNLEFNMNNIIRVNKIQNLNDFLNIINNQNILIENLSKEINILRLKVNNL